MMEDYIVPVFVGITVFLLVMMIGFNVESRRDVRQDQHDEIMERLEQIEVRLEYNRAHDNACYPPPGPGVKNRRGA